MRYSFPFILSFKIVFTAYSFLSIFDTANRTLLEILKIKKEDYCLPEPKPPAPRYFFNV